MENLESGTLSKESDAFARGSRVWQVPSSIRCLNTKRLCQSEWRVAARVHGKEPCTRAQLGPSDRFLLKFSVVLKSNRSLYMHVYACLNPESGISQL